MRKVILFFGLVFGLICANTQAQTLVGYYEVTDAFGNKTYTPVYSSALSQPQQVVVTQSNKPNGAEIATAVFTALTTGGVWAGNITQWTGGGRYGYGYQGYGNRGWYNGGNYYNNGYYANGGYYNTGYCNPGYGSWGNRNF